MISSTCFLTSSLRAEFDKGADILPNTNVFFAAIAVEFFEAIAHFPGNIIGNFPNSAISLQGTTRDIQGNIGYQSHPHRQEFRNDFFAVTDKDLIAEQLDLPLGDIHIRLQLWKV